jgi:hypothetical protein
MGASLVPQIGAAGIYTLLAPFDTKLTPNTNYTCKAVRTIDDLLASGVDPYATYYNPTGTPIDRTTYNADVAAGVQIVSLFSASGTPVYVPSTYIQSFPAAGGVPYAVMCMAVQIPAIPESLDLGPCKTQIIAIVKDTLGMDATITEVQLTEITLVDQATSQRYEAARQANITNSTTDNAKLIAAQTALAAAQQQITLLQDYIKNNPPASPG